jgi:cell wall-associated NlpC family hydrolase
MFVRKFCAYAFAASIIAIISLPAFSQGGDARPRQTPADLQEVTCSPDDVVIVSEAAPAPAQYIAREKTITMSSPVGLDRFQQLMNSAIDERLGSRYRWGGTGPNGFDCSGFVWSIFQAAGISFERGSARNLWGRFEAPAPEDQYKFGTLVFFSNLAHVGVVVDQNGFYHASRHHGVVYSPFNDYWVSRIDGFRRVPLTLAKVSE